ncbi:hypothetical protein GCM10010136_32180 [Limoniibacter endophyticus]|uniref:Uncharacterized protein n=1 Tax=Limoniibacter endophyticus TaxID=1565040 RepID=A0A8J3DJY5_9HYPH|nr:hypothetical protein GCM10010136_32180 [Limoniibacter endophyticus]
MTLPNQVPTAPIYEICGSQVGTFSIPFLTYDMTRFVAPASDEDRDSEKEMSCVTSSPTGASKCQ